MIPFQIHRRIPFVRRPFYQRDQAIAERNQLAVQCAGLRLERAELEQKWSKLDAQYSVLRLERDDLEQNLFSLAAECSELRLERDEFKQSLSKLNAQYSALSLERDDLEQKWSKAVLAAESYVFDDDGMKLWDKNLSSLNEPRFMRAYELGFAGGPPIQFRAYVCCWAASQAAKIPGDFVECGVNEGWLSLTVCHYLDLNTLNKSFYLFDTYQGIPSDQITEREKARAALHNYSECYQITKKKFEIFSKAKLVRGKIPETLSMERIDKVSYLSIDMNIAKPERDAIEFFWPKLSVGGIVILDDYAFGGYEAQHESMDAFAAKVGVQILTLPTGQGLIIKG